ncbi:hypothetical protein PWT90_04132 [Aphanocladium album]|nr:hypothetical protein PWT90_04132 [Aphanocladium album]
MAEVLVTKGYTFQKPEIVGKVYGRVLGFGLLLAEGQAHKLQRRKLQPAFAFRNIKELYPLFWDKTRQVVNAMTTACGEHGISEMEVHSWTSRCTLDIVGLAGFGTDLGAIDDNNTEFVQACDTLFEPSRQAQILALCSTFLPQWVVNVLPVQRNQDIYQAAHIIRSKCLDIIHKNADKKPADWSTQVKDVLTLAMGSGLFSDDELVDQMMTFLAAGQGTSAGSMSWAIYMLAKYPDMQTRIRTEIRSKVSSLEAPISSADIDGMTYLQAFCSEVLRYWCPVPVFARTATEDTTVVNYPVRRGLHVTISPWAMNRDPAQWGPDAGTFNPDRWMAKGDGEDTAADRKTGSGGVSTNYGFATFSHGPKSCIGQGFAKAEFACLLAGWVGRFDFALKDAELLDERKIKISKGLVARPTPPMTFTVKVLAGF